MNPSLAFPPGDTSSDTIIDAIHFNLTTLKHWNYTLYGNATLSNESTCILVFSPYTPLLLLANGTFINATTCYTPILPIKSQGLTGLTFGILLASSIILTLLNLHKHGHSLLPHETRSHPISRRWQWYWMLFVATCGILSTLTAIDIDRDYVQSTALTLRSFFYTLQFPGLLAASWEATRHWSSWSARQLCDAEPLALRPRSRTESYQPLGFYLFDWVVFFTTVARPWSAVQMQRSAAQAESVARPMATDARFKAGAGFAVLALLVPCYCVRHTLFYYQKDASQHAARTHPVTHRNTHWLCARLSMELVHLPYRVGVGIPWLYGLGHGPALLLLVVLNIYGFLEQNDDRILISQRVRRNAVANRELGITRASRKPSWWSKSHNKAQASAEELLTDMAFDPSNPSAATDNVGATLDDDHTGKWWWQRRDEGQEGLPNQELSSSASSTYAYAGSMLGSISPPAGLRPERASSATGSDQSMRSRQSRPQVVRSMLDV